MDNKKKTQVGKQSEKEAQLARAREWAKYRSDPVAVLLADRIDELTFAWQWKTKPMPELMSSLAELVERAHEMHSRYPNAAWGDVASLLDIGRTSPDPEELFSPTATRLAAYEAAGRSIPPVERG